jgi:hypothetical protein
MARAIKHPVTEGDVVVADGDIDTRDEIRAAERAEFGGMKFGSAFFGWLTAAGLGVLLTALVAAILTALGLSAEDVGDGVARVVDLGIAGAIAVAVVVFIAYFAGGYVAGRMARFSGAIQGFAVWLWAIIIAFLAAGLVFLFGDRFDFLGNLQAFPRIPFDTDDITVSGIVTAVVLALIPLVAAILGGLAGMRYHRRVDRAGLDREVLVDRADVDDTVVVEK